MQHIGHSIVTTNSNHIYDVDWDKHIVTCEALNGTHSFVSGCCLVGFPMTLSLCDGRTLKTSIVKNVRMIPR